ncbi:hypothetical protein ACFXHA_19095 [Nocardia sp. NPDC059240]|uniref:hypothetical protein n=1 Tax=Nocardia sp. NPDC059240 TaxID=3346786 RepID=UPI0036911C5D
MTTIVPAPRALTDDGFRLLHVDFPGRCDHGDLPCWMTDTDIPVRRDDRGGER